MITSVLSEPGRFGPLDSEHPGVGRACCGCGYPLLAGDAPALVNGIPAGEEEQGKADKGRAHILEALLAHEECAAIARRRGTL